MLLKKFQNLSVARKMWALFLGLLLCNVLVAGGLFSYLQNVEQRVSAAVQAVADVSYVYTTTKTKVEARSLSRCVVGVPDAATARDLEGRERITLGRRP